MQELSLVDFYYGWSIEVVQHEQGFSSICYSPSRRRLIDSIVYAQSFQAVKAAKQAINRQITSSTIASFLRDMYESEKLSFDEWQWLNQSSLEVLNAG